MSKAKQDTNVYREYAEAGLFIAGTAIVFGNMPAATVALFVTGAALMFDSENKKSAIVRPVHQMCAKMAQKVEPK